MSDIPTCTCAYIRTTHKSNCPVRLLVEQLQADLNTWYRWALDYASPEEHPLPNTPPEDER